MRLMMISTTIRHPRESLSSWTLSVGLAGDVAGEEKTDDVDGLRARIAWAAQIHVSLNA